MKDIAMNIVVGLPKVHALKWKIQGSYYLKDSWIFSSQCDKCEKWLTVKKMKREKQILTWFFQNASKCRKNRQRWYGYNMLHAKKALLKYATLSHIFGGLLTVKHALSYL